MKKKRFTEAQMIGVLKEGAAGAKASELFRKHGISDATYYKWKGKYAGMSVAELRRVKELEADNRSLSVLAGAELDKAALKDVLSRKW